MSINFPLFNKQQNTVAVAQTHSRIEGFLNGLHPHNTGTGGTTFLHDVRGENNVLNVAKVNVWGKDAKFAKDAAAHRKVEKSKGNTVSVFISVETQWQAPEFETGKMNGEYKEMNSVMMFSGKNIIQVNPFKTGENPREIIGMANPYTQNIELFEDKENTIAPAEWFSRIEGFLSGYIPHQAGNGGLIFLNDVRQGKNPVKHVARINVFGDDALMARDAAEHLRNSKNNPIKESVFFSINTRWQAPEKGTGVEENGYEKKTSTMTMIGKEIIQINPKRSGEYARGVLRTSESHAEWLRSEGLHPEPNPENS